jgi:MoaA/NifB/PqqE/SkfB family radical SAM enzyme
MTTQTSALPAEAEGLQFLWLELTARCNLRCTHCYANSGPDVQTADELGLPEYEWLLEDAAELGCRRVQFIGGEPTLFSGLPLLIRRAAALGFEFIEIFTNATHVPEGLLSTFRECGVHVATSFYCDLPEIHDSITQRPGSHARTIRTLRRLLEANVPLRAGVIVMDQNRSRVDATLDYLRSLGIAHIGIDRVRGIGRAQQAESDDLHELCGSCWRGSLAVGPDGVAAPCIMSKHWQAGSVRSTTLHDLVHGDRLRAVRRNIWETVWVPRENRGLGLHRWDGAASCAPDCVPVCNPQCSPNCSPCYPYGKCNPELFCGPCGPGR